MKKSFFILIIITLTGCTLNNNNESNIVSELNDNKTIENTSYSHDFIEDEAEHTASEKEKIYPLKPVSDVPNVVSFIPQEYYYNDQGELIVKGEVRNDNDFTATGVRVRRLEIYNEDEELIASNCFGYIYDNTRFDPNESFEITYRFPAITVLTDDDLDSINVVFKTSSAVEYYDSFIKKEEIIIKEEKNSPLKSMRNVKNVLYFYSK